jgi:hypothetical protein
LNSTILEILSRGEIWALIFPIIAILMQPKQPKFMYPILIYIGMSLWFNLLIEMVDLFYDDLSPSHRTNTIFYNGQSLGRFFCFVAFFFSIKHRPFRKLQKILLATFLFFFFFYFGFIDSFFNPKYISSDLMTGEAFFLLAYCMLYYLTILREEPQSFWARKDFWVVTGLCFFSAINFFLFLFYLPLLNESINNAIDIWRIFSVAFIIFMLFLTKAIYVPASDKH